MARDKHRDLAKRAAEARSDLNIFYGIIAILEGGTMSAEAQPDDFQIIEKCKRAAQKCLVRYDRALAQLTAADGRTK